MRPDVGPLGHLLLARSGVEREARHRGDPDLVRRLRETATAVLRLRGDRALTTSADALDLDTGPTTHPDALWFYLGREPDGREHLASWEPAPADGPAGEEPDDWRTLREVGASLGDRDAGLFTTAQALANRHVTHSRCPRCGEATEPTNAGWSPAGVRGLGGLPAARAGVGECQLASARAVVNRPGVAVAEAATDLAQRPPRPGPGASSEAGSQQARCSRPSGSRPRYSQRASGGSGRRRRRGRGASANRR